MLMLLATCYSLLVPGYIMKHEKHVILALNTVLRPLSLSLSLSLSTKFCPLDRGRPFLVLVLVLVQNFDTRGLALAKNQTNLSPLYGKRKKNTKNNKHLFN